MTVMDGSIQTTPRYSTSARMATAPLTGMMNGDTTTLTTSAGRPTARASTYSITTGATEAMISVSATATYSYTTAIHGAYTGGTKPCAAKHTHIS